MKIPAPDPSRIPSLDDLLGSSALMICALYHNSEFFRCSFFVDNVYQSNINIEDLNENNFDISKVYRSILTKKPRIILKDIEWDAPDYEKYLNIQKHQKIEIENLKQENEKRMNEFSDVFRLKENSLFASNL